MSTPVVDVPESPAELTRSPSLGEYFRSYLDRVRGGDIGSLPAVFGLIVLVIVFSILRPVFFSAGNFANLLTQGAPITVIAMGLVFVLLLGEIDLSAGFTSGVCAAIFRLNSRLSHEGICTPTNPRPAAQCAIPSSVLKGA